MPCWCRSVPPMVEFATTDVGMNMAEILVLTQTRGKALPLERRS